MTTNRAVAVRDAVNIDTRRPRGRRVLALEDVREIRLRHALGDRLRDIVRAFPQVQAGAVRCAARGETFRHVRFEGFEAELFERLTR